MGSTTSIIIPFVLCFLISTTGGRRIPFHNTPHTENGNRYSNLTRLINRHTIHHQLTYGTYFQVKNAIWCNAVPEEVVKYLLKNIELIFFYGPSLSDWITAPLKNALNLVKDFRWNKKKPMAVYTHGWVDSPALYYSSELEEAYITNGKFNLVMVDWSGAGAFVQYRFSATLVRPIGEAVAGALQTMIDAGVELDHVVGHSLGAHISGHIGRNLKKRPRLVVGLDPAGPLFYPTMNKCEEELLSSDGDYVVALHTDEGQLGANEPTGPADFYAVGGSRQPGCGVLDDNKFGHACSTNRAIILWSEAIVDSNSIIGQLCSSYHKYQNNLCQHMPVSKLAEPDTNLEGLFFFSTNSFSPFGKGSSGVTKLDNAE